MKTDLEKFIELYESIGITLEPKSYDGKGEVFLCLTDGMNEKVTGYFQTAHTHIIFDKHGKFIQQGIYDE